MSDRVTDLGGQPLLLGAALSHLELALVHLHEQVHNLRTEERVTLHQVSEQLKEWATVEACSVDKDYDFPHPRTFNVKRLSVDSDIARGISSLSLRHDGPTNRFQEDDINVFDRTASQSSLCTTADIDGFALDIVDQVPQQEKVDGENSQLDASPLEQMPPWELPAPECDPAERDVAQLQLYKQFMDIFDELDLDKEGAIDHMELRTIFTHMGLPPAHAAKVFHGYDQKGLGKIGRAEWLRMVQHFEDKDDDSELHAFLQALVDRFSAFGQIYEPSASSRCILRHDSRQRMFWDFFMVLTLTFISLTLPLQFAFGSDVVHPFADTGIDCLFILDVVINFRTTFVSKNQEVVENPHQIAVHYFKTWFFLDFVSSVPIQQISVGLDGWMGGENTNMNAAKLFKIGKIAKALKILRIGKMIKIVRGSALIEDLEEFLWSHHAYSLARLLRLMTQLLVAAHWFACFLITLQGDTFEAYFNTLQGDIIQGRQPTDSQVYLAALYWSMMTMTTVGYGDITVKTDHERIFAVAAMICGGAFYGFVIGSITALVGQSDMNRRAFKERMDLVMAWLDAHDELPHPLRRRIWRHFKDHLSKKTAVEDSIIMNDLSTNLKNDVSAFLMHDDVKHNPLFEGLSTNDLSQLAFVVERVAVQSIEQICGEGEVGHAMFIIVRGFAEKTMSQTGVSYKLCPGDSFGEEIVLGMKRRYAYSICAETKVSLCRINMKEFQEIFKNRPDAISKMKANFERYNTSGMSGTRSTDRGRSSLLDGGAECVPPTFPDAVFEAFHELGQKIQMFNGQGRITQESRSGSI
jgi:hyperpolarization activated cyclic nucleotide-gated potassium channel 2